MGEGGPKATDEVAPFVLVKWREALYVCNLRDFIIPLGVASPVLGEAFKMRQLSFDLLSFIGLPLHVVSLP